MQVLFVLRDGKPRVFGGDAVMVRGIQRHLHSFGASTSLTTAAELPTTRAADIVHVTFLDAHESVRRTADWAADLGVPVVISPLFEDQLALWFEWAIQKPGVWQRVSQALGWSISRNLYSGWQLSRIRHTKEWREQRYLLANMHILPNSRYELDHLKTWFRLEELQATVIPLGVDSDIFATSPQDRSIPGVGNLTGYVLQVGRIETRKNQLGLLRALRHSSMPVVLLGSTRGSEYEAPYVAACRSLANTRGNVYFLEWVSDVDMVQLYARAAVHVLPSWSERPGLVSLEATACSCKAVCSESSPIQEYLGGDAWYCKPQSSKSIASTIERAMSSPFPEHLRHKVLTQYTWENTARRMLYVYESLIH